MSEKVKLDESVLESIAHTTNAQDVIRKKLFDLSNSERIIKKEIETLWEEFYKLSETLSPILQDLEREHGTDSYIDLSDGTITPSGNLPE